MGVPDLKYDEIPDLPRSVGAIFHEVVYEYFDGRVIENSLSVNSFLGEIIFDKIAQA